MPRGSSANAKTFFFRFARLPQTPKHFPRDLREYPQTPRQTPRDLREYPQTPKHFPRDLREYPQTPKHFPWDLRNFRGVFPKALWPLTARDQRHSPGIRESILSSNSRCLRDHPFPIGNSMQNAFLNSHCQQEMRRKTRFACRRQVEMRFSGLISYVCP